MLFVGDDWAEAHHDIEVQDEQGRRLARRRLPEGLSGIATLHALLAEHLPADAEPDQVVVGIETDRGTWVQALRAAGYQVFAINPLSVARYRERHVTSGAKSDPGDAKVLADLVRTDRQHHRPIAGDSELAEAVKVLARTHQNLIWTRQRQTNALRSTLREFYPAALMAFEDLAHLDALAVLAKAPTPQRGAALRRTQVEAALRAGGRKRNITSRAEQVVAALRTEQLQALPLVADAFGATVSALVAVTAELVRQIDTVEQKLSASFEQHPSAEILRSLPGLGGVLGARVLAEFGDDPHRYADARARKNYAGTSPITRASGTRRVVLARHARNRRLADALYQWAFSALTSSPAARAYYDAQRARGATHHQALRALGNRLVGVLHGCLRHDTAYDENTAWPRHAEQAGQAAA
ncbi:MAG TPA: IS110 family transposase [Egibacteraceae bacterium]|nr:IS110 family transposase [Egibacteraceae bacterium]